MPVHAARPRAPEGMNFLAIVIALALEQWRTFRWRGGVQRAFIRYARVLEQRFNAGTAQQGTIAAALALVPPVAIAAAGYWALEVLHPLLGLVWNVFILYLLVGFRHFSHAFSAIADALKAGDVIAAPAPCCLARHRGQRGDRGGDPETGDRAGAGRFVPARLRNAVLVSRLARTRGRRALSPDRAARRALARRCRHTDGSRARPIRPAGGEAAVLARLGAGSAHRSDLRHRWRFRGRDLLLANAGQGMALAARRNPARQRRGCARRADRRGGDRADGRARIPPRVGPGRGRGRGHDAERGGARVARVTGLARRAAAIDSRVLGAVGSASDCL